MELPVDEIDEALFAVATRVTIHNGKTTKFWSSSWLQGCSLASMFPALFNHSRNKKWTVPEAMASDNWIRDMMHDMPESLSESLFMDYIQLWHLVADSSFNPMDQLDDEIVWTRTASGKYSAKSAYNIQFNGGTELEFPKAIWQVWAPSKCKFFTWLLLQNRVLDCRQIISKRVA
jgi:hypothetical protein